MSRRKKLHPDDAAERAMGVFWRSGYHATSVDALVRAVGVSRHSLYADFGGKEGLFAACLALYADKVVTPAFAQVAAPDARLDAVAAYFEAQIARAMVSGLPGPGCLFANSMTEAALTSEPSAAAVAAHLDRLRTGFSNALRNEATARGATPTPGEIAAMAEMLAAFANGLWSTSRAVRDPGPLREAVAAMIALLNRRLSP